MNLNLYACPDSPSPVTMFRHSIELGQQTLMALLQWGYPVFDGRTPITHYSIQINTGIQQNTLKTSYEAKFVYNTSANVSVTAYNCVGHSEPVSIQIFHDGRFINLLLTVNVTCYLSYTFRGLSCTFFWSSQKQYFKSQ